MYKQLVFNSKSIFNKTIIKNKRNYRSVKVFGYNVDNVNINNQFNVESNEGIGQICNGDIKNFNFVKLVEVYRKHGHVIGNINPVPLEDISSLPLTHFTPQKFGLEEQDIVQYEGIVNVNNEKQGSIADAMDKLKTTYTHFITAEFMHLQNSEEINWFSQQMESISYDSIDKNTKTLLATELLKSQMFDYYLATKFPGLKRYGGEGAESMMAFFMQLFKQCKQENLEQLVVCMPHRGRLNLLTGMLNFPPAHLFKKLKGVPDFPDQFIATGDVISHCISSTSFENLHISLLYNPSHLEAVNPVSMGKTRAKQLSTKDGDYSPESNQLKWSSKVLNVQVHGDAAYIGQGVNQECLVLSKVPHFEVGGSVHLVVNNQVGFTTPALRGRSSRYCTDLAKIIDAPVIHVNGAEPESVLLATKLALSYQRQFRKEVFLDLNCYRQWGHNELDDPTFTNPKLYTVIRKRSTVPDSYAKTLCDNGVMNEQQVQQIKDDHRNWLDQELQNSDDHVFKAPCFDGQWNGFRQADPNFITDWDTGVSIDLLRQIAKKSVEFPDDFAIHPHLQRTYIKNRLARIENGTSIDWSTAETLAIGSLMYEGFNVRLSGQDVGRGTFSHRHVMLVDQKNDHTYIPLNQIHPQQTGFLEVANSVLSEEAVLGFEYGMSIENPNNLIIWEAQFGDFSNGAQIIIDTFISSGELKWLWSSGLVMLLPHGYDGAGPEHSSARIERFLQLTDSKGIDGDNINLQVAQPSTPAQYFHLLRRQMKRNFRKPLIIIAPKTLLRLSAAVSEFEDFNIGSGFKSVLDDTEMDKSNVKKVIFTSGKQYYELVSKRKELEANNTAIVRVECFCPFPAEQLQKQVSKYPKATKFIWSQEEPENMGAWTFLQPKFESITGRKILYCGRPIMGAPAVGIGNVHKEQATYVTTRPFEM